MNKFTKLNIAALMLFSFSAYAVDGVAVIDMRTAVLSTQSAQDAFKALQEDADYAANVESFRAYQTERQSLVEKLQKEAETLSNVEIAEIQKDIQNKTKELEFLLSKIQGAEEETTQKIFVATSASLQKIIGELISAKQIKLLLAKSESILFNDAALDITDDVTSMLDVNNSAD